MQIYKFGHIYLNAESRQVIKDGKPVVLTPKTFDVLQFLIENHGKIVSKDELLGKVWNGNFVEEGNLAVQISKLRSLLLASKTDPFIETVPGEGYRFVATVQPVDSDEWKKISNPEKKFLNNNLPEQIFSDSIAVLPLENEVNNEETEYLADGLTETIINSLTYIPNLKVIARNSVFRYKNKDADIKEVSEKLGVSKILTGRIKLIKNNLTIGVEMINTVENSQIWGANFSQPFSDVFKIQEEIISAVTEKLRSEIRPNTKNSFKNFITENNESYRLYLKGKYFLNNQKEQSIYKAIDCFEKSISHDPLNIYSYVEVIESFRLLYICDYISYSEALTKIKPLLSIIENLNQSIAEVQVVLGAVKEAFEWKFEEALTHYQTALVLNPNCVSVRYRYLISLTDLGKFSEALKEANKLITLDPLSANSYRHIGRMFFKMGQFTNAISYLREYLDLEPDDYISLAILGAVLTELGEFDEALEVLDKSLEIQFNLDVLSFIGYTYALSNKTDKARKIIEQLKTQFQHKHHISLKLAMIHLALGEKETAYELLNKAVEEHDIDLIAIKIDPRFKSLHNDQKFKEFLAKLGLPLD